MPLGCDLCVSCLTLPITPPGAVLACLSCSASLLQGPLTLSLTRAGLGLSCRQGRKLPSLVGLVSRPCFVPPQEPPRRGWERRAPADLAGGWGWAGG